MLPEIVTFLIVLGVIAIALFVSSIKVVRQSTAVVVERLGIYRTTLTAGFHMICHSSTNASRILHSRNKYWTLNHNQLLPKTTLLCK